MPKKTILGPTFNEMLHPETIPENFRKAALQAKHRDPLDPINFFNITWKNEKNEIPYFVLPKQITGVLALLLIVAALTAMLSGLPYWLYASFLTPAIVLMDASANDVFELAAERVAFTLFGACVAVGLAFLVNLVVHWRRRRAGVSGLPAT